MGGRGISAFPGFWTISVHVVIGETRWYLATPAANYGFQIATRAQWELYQAEARDLLKRPIPLATTTIVGTIFSAFRDLAVDARVSEQDPDGTIEIDEGQIRRVRFHYSGGPSYKDPHPHNIQIECLVPDSRIRPAVRSLRISLVREKSFPVFGPVKTARWDVKGAGPSGATQRDKDFMSGIEGRLNQGEVLSGAVKIHVSPRPDEGGWILTPGKEELTKWCRASSLRSVWDCHQAIAEALLATPMPTDE